MVCKKCDDLEKTVVFLWGIIDDIDTYGDMAKSDDSLYRSLVERKQKERWESGITTDGYDLDMSQLVVQRKNNHDIETMRRNSNG